MAIITSSIYQIMICCVPCALGPGILARGNKGMKKGQTPRHKSSEDRIRWDCATATTSYLESLLNTVQLEGLASLGKNEEVSVGKKSQAVNICKEEAAVASLYPSFINTHGLSAKESFAIPLESGPHG